MQKRASERSSSLSIKIHPDIKWIQELFIIITLTLPKALTVHKRSIYTADENIYSLIRNRPQKTSTLSVITLLIAKASADFAEKSLCIKLPLILQNLPFYVK